MGLGLRGLDLGLGLDKNISPRGPSYGHSKKFRQVLLDFLGGVLIGSIYLGMLPSHYPLELVSYAIRAALPWSLDTILP